MQIDPHSCLDVLTEFVCIDHREWGTRFGVPRGTNIVHRCPCSTKRSPGGMACCGTREPYPTYVYVFKVLSAEIIVIIIMMMMMIMIIIICYQSIHFMEEMCEVCHFVTQEACIYMLHAKFDFRLNCFNLS